MGLQADNISTLIKAANVKVEPYFPSLFAKLFETKSVGDLITNVGAGETQILGTDTNSSSCSETYQPA